ncbi:MAG TPA: cation:proton antiporter [Polyangia bacterium]|jgi:Kef-type K+ transport system membrane component KefB/nucleotide-binding universal stress UspA family protein
MQNAQVISNHGVFLLLIELALLIGVTRIGAEIFKRLGLPAVVGELGAGILLGPSVFGRFSPGMFTAIFPAGTGQFQLLDVIGTLGMTFLLLLTGLETDVKLVRNLGRAALMTSGAGMVLPFVLGFALGSFMPDVYLANPQHRTLFSLFLATTMSISAMPVIAKILVDLDLTKRNIGLVILSAGVVDDTAGWLILSLLAGAATHGSVRIGQLGLTVLYLAAFLAFAVFILSPLLRWLVRVTVERFRVADSDLALIVVTTLFCAALTERIGVHAVFGAFIAGLVLHQVPRLKKDTVARLESFVMSVLAPVFFGIVGLKVDLGALGGGRMFGVVLAVACLGKLIGCALGAVWGGLRFWEAASLAVAMNARGAMGIVAATIGLGLGILGTQMFSIIVMMAIVTSFMAPIGLRLTVPRVRITDDERQRITAAGAKGMLDPEHLRVLLPTGGGPNALVVAPIGFGLALRSSVPVEVLWVELKTTWRTRLGRMFDGAPVRNAEQYLALLKEQAAGQKAPEIKKVVAADVARAICDEASTCGADMIMLGSNRQDDIGGALIEQVVEHAPCHVAIMRGHESHALYKRIFVPVDGSVAARLAVEFAHRYAENTGAELTLAVITERRPQAIAYADTSGARPVLEAAAAMDAELERISVVFRASVVKPQIVRLAYDPLSSAVTTEARTGRYDLVVLGAENRAIQHRLFFGYDAERLLRATRVPVIIVVPNVSRIV